MKHLLKLSDLTDKEILEILNLADQLKYERKHNIAHRHLEGKTLGMIFQKSSTRTRVSFETGMYQLGGQALFLSNRDLQIGRGEPVQDTARVLSRYLDGIMIRTFEQKEVEDLAKYGSIPVINGLTDYCHPCQILADLMTIREYKGSFKGLKACFVGDGNNMANSLIVGCLKVGMSFALACPKGYEPCEDILQFAKNYGGKKTASNQFFYNTGTMNLWGPMNFEGNFSHGKLTNKGGTINSIAANFVSIAAGAPIPLDVIDPNNAVTTITANSYRGESTLGETPEWYPHMVFDGGTLNIIDYAPSSPVAAKLREKFNGQNGAQLIFSGSRTSMAADEWNLATIRAIQAEGFNDYIFYRNDLNAQNAGVNVGNSSSIANNIGFRTINGTSSISVTNGRRLTVTGIGSGYAVDRDVSISNGTLRLGHSSVGTNGGSIHNIAFSGGALEIARGAWLGSTVQGNGNLSVAQNSSLGLAEIKNIDCITNSGTLSVSRDVAVSGTINNTGYLTVSNLLKFGTNAKLINNGGTLQTNNVFNIFDSVGSRGRKN